MRTSDLSRESEFQCALLCDRAIKSKYVFDVLSRDVKLIRVLYNCNVACFCEALVARPFCSHGYFLIWPNEA